MSCSYQDGQEQMSRRIPTTGPDFICIGMQKAGTRWLYQQLREHPDFWMPPIKEFHFFNKRFDKEGNVKIIKRDAPDVAHKVQRGHASSTETRDDKFFRLASSYEEGLGIEWYERLFEPKGDLISGDITPAYSTLSEECIREISLRFRGLRIILLLRDPVERLWSQLCMQWRRGEVSSDDLNDRIWVRKRVLSKSAYLQRMYPTKIWGKWATFFDSSAMNFWFIEDIASTPYDTVKRITTFLGGFTLADAPRAEVNTKATNKKLPLSDEVRTELVRIFSDEISACAELFGSHATSWKEKYSKFG